MAGCGLAGNTNPLIKEIILCNLLQSNSIQSGGRLHLICFQVSVVFSNLFK